MLELVDLMEFEVVVASELGVALSPSRKNGQKKVAKSGMKRKHTSIRKLGGRVVG